MHEGAVSMIHIERATRAALLPLRTEHEVVDDELTSAIEKIRECDLAIRAVEHVILVDLYPWQLTPLPAQLIAHPRELLLPGQQLLSSGQPFLLPYHFRMFFLARRLCHVHFSFAMGLFKTGSLSLFFELKRSEEHTS